jgi:hypothetical protein
MQCLPVPASDMSGRVPSPQPLSLRSFSNLDDPRSHRLVSLAIGPRGGEVEYPDSRDPVAGQHRQGKVFGPGAAKAHSPKFIRRTLKTALSGLGSVLATVPSIGGF